MYGSQCYPPLYAVMACTVAQRGIVSLLSAAHWPLHYNIRKELNQCMWPDTVVITLLSSKGFWLKPLSYMGRASEAPSID
jgi:hypothetical protein